jgi:Fe-S-cluster-containing dehydrogenase component
MTWTRRRFLIGMGAGSVVFYRQVGAAVADGKPNTVVRYAMIHDEQLCNGCNLCVTACGKVNDVPEGARRLNIAHVVVASSAESDDYHYFRLSCQQCEQAPCIDVCPTGASWRDETTGVVRVNRPQCIGCGYCISGCPYQARYLNERTHVADKCDFCLETRLSKGFDPICATVCPQKALLFGREDSPKIQSWLKNNQYYEYQLPGVGKPHIYRRFAQHKISKLEGKDS